jgi:hypothetical protein
MKSVIDACGSPVDYVRRVSVAYEAHLAHAAELDGSRRPGHRACTEKTEFYQASLVVHRVFYTHEHQGPHHPLLATAYTAVYK